jgi:hypothetical protein
MLSDMGSNCDALTVGLHFGVDLAACDALDTLQAFLRAFVPGYCPDLRVLRYERDRDAFAVDVSCDGQLREAILAQGGYRGEAYNALAAEDPPPHQRRFGSALIYGADRSAYLSVSYDEYVPARPGLRASAIGVIDHALRSLLAGVRGASTAASAATRLVVVAGACALAFV